MLCFCGIGPKTIHSSTNIKINGHNCEYINVKDKDMTYDSYYFNEANCGLYIQFDRYNTIKDIVKYNLKSKSINSFDNQVVKYTTNFSDSLKLKKNSSNALGQINSYNKNLLLPLPNISNNKILEYKDTFRSRSPKKLPWEYKEEDPYTPLSNKGINDIIEDIPIPTQNLARLDDLY